MELMLSAWPRHSHLGPASLRQRRSSVSHLGQRILKLELEGTKDTSVSDFRKEDVRS